MKNKLNKFGLILFSIFTPFIVSAHVKWFSEDSINVRPYEITDSFVLLSILLVIILILLGVYLERKLHVPQRLNKFIQQICPKILSIASIGFGLAFIIFTIKGFIFAPNLVAVGEFGKLMLVIQGLIGVMMFFGVFERIGGFLVLVLFGLGVHEYGFVEMLDTLEMVGFALYAMIVGRPLWKIVDTNIFSKYNHQIHSYGYPFLRIGTGLNLIVLGFTEKILAPSMTGDFLNIYKWNFMDSFSLSDYWFAYFAGVAEITFGIFFVLGLITRITTLVLAVFLLATLYLLGPIELIGHLPHFSIAIALLVLGSGSRLVLIRNS